jgi:hypothetical protein
LNRAPVFETLANAKESHRLIGFILEMDENDYLDYWGKLRTEVETFGALDDLRLTFGARTRGFGHDFKVLPTVSGTEIAAFERRTGLDLPLEYRSYLQVFGAGGAGPDYGIHDFRETVQNGDYPVPFPLTETQFSLDEEIEDDDPIWDMPGTAPICSHGCGAESSIELHGANPGYIWCQSGTDIIEVGTFYGFYRRWADKVRTGLTRYDLLKSALNRKTWYGRPRKLGFGEIVDIMGCEYREFDQRESDYQPVDEFKIYFDGTPACVVLNLDREVLRIETFQLS